MNGLGLWGWVAVGASVTILGVYALAQPAAKRGWVKRATARKAKAANKKRVKRLCKRLEVGTVGKVTAKGYVDHGRRVRAENAHLCQAKNQTGGKCGRPILTYCPFHGKRKEAAA